MASWFGQWWQAPVYSTVAVLLAFLAISAAIRSLPRDDDDNDSFRTKPNVHTLALNASRALRKCGFNIFATVFQVSPEIYPFTRNTTIFAIEDSAISNTSLPPALFKQLLHYHTSPVKLSMVDLLNKTLESCLPTFLDRKNIAVTKVDSKNRMVEINHIPVTHPDILLEGPLSIHGVLGPFSSLDPPRDFLGWDYIHSPICDSNLKLIFDVNGTKNRVEWTKIIRLLSSHGFVSFAIGLHSALDGILEDGKNLNSVTVFSPLGFSFVAPSSPLLHRIVRFHILSQRLTYTELAALPGKAQLRTLVPDQKLEIDGGINSTKGLTINGATIIAPDILSSKRFVVHGISQAFDVALFPKLSR
ncbi:hypothetical protein SLA2020_009900 [Shorea laevis]